MLTRLALLAALTAGLAPAVHAQSADGTGDLPGPLDPHRTGAFEAILTTRAEQSDPGRWAERFQFGGDLRSWDYDLATETFSLRFMAFMGKPSRQSRTSL